MRLFLLLVGASLFLAGCGRQDRETRLYGPDAAKLAGDTAPWRAQPYAGNQAAWDHQEEKRARLMNEYNRIR